MTFNFSNARLIKLAIHFIGNKQNGEVLFTTNSIEEELSKELKDILSNYFLSSYKTLETYNFWHESELELNDVYNFAYSIFSDIDNFDLKSKNIAKHLYEKSVHPKIKSGELYVSYCANRAFQVANHE